MHALIDADSIIVSEGDATMVVAASDPAHDEVRRYLVEEKGSDFSKISTLLNTMRVGVKAVVKEAVSVVDGDSDSDSGGESGEPAYRITHGDPVEEVLLATAIRLTRETSDLAPLGAFLRRLDRNPSQASRSQLFGWLKAGGFTITTDGLIVGYKSVRTDGLSAHGGREPVTVVRQDGSSETVTGRVPYPVGATVWMPRNLVDDNRDSACSVGLHVGTFNYAQTFSDEMLVVLVDPADVVSVPTCSGAQKMRVCKLYVAAAHDGEQIAEAVIANIRTVPDFDATEDYISRPENQPSPTFGVTASFGDADYEDSDEDDESDEDDDYYGCFGYDSDEDEDDESDEDDEDDEDDRTAAGHDESGEDSDGVVDLDETVAASENKRDTETAGSEHDYAAAVAAAYAAGFTSGSSITH